jgi:hypothetical protein
MVCELITAQAEAEMQDWTRRFENNLASIPQAARNNPVLLVTTPASRIPNQSRALLRGVGGARCAQILSVSVLWG